MDEEMKKCQEEIKQVMEKYSVLFKVVPDYRIEIVLNPEKLADKKVSQIITDINKN